MHPDNTPEVVQVAAHWIYGPNTGESSKMIWAHMMSVKSVQYLSYPHDPADINRCFELLRMIPAWRMRMGEMAVYGPAWAALVENWERLQAMFEDEAGPNWSKSKMAHNTYEAMRAILDPIERRRG